MPVVFDSVPLVRNPLLCDGGGRLSVRRQMRAGGRVH